MMRVKYILRFVTQKLQFEVAAVELQYEVAAVAVDTKATTNKEV